MGISIQINTYVRLKEKYLLREMCGTTLSPSLKKSCLFFETQILVHSQQKVSLFQDKYCQFLVSFFLDKCILIISKRHSH
jgi:hypothetical protein